MFTGNCTLNGGTPYVNHFFEFLTTEIPWHMSINITVQSYSIDSFHRCTWERGQRLVTCPGGTYYQGPLDSQYLSRFNPTKRY
ncbi:hypothetical protein RSAG8_09431, partial [Rhizoctonia solani AG-8 WAC10335]